MNYKTKKIMASSISIILFAVILVSLVLFAVPAVFSAKNGTLYDDELKSWLGKNETTTEMPTEKPIEKVNLFDIEKCKELTFTERDFTYHIFVLELPIGSYSIENQSNNFCIKEFDLKIDDVNDFMQVFEGGSELLGMDQYKDGCSINVSKTLVTITPDNLSDVRCLKIFKA